MLVRVKKTREKGKEREGESKGKRAKKMKLFLLWFVQE